MQELMQGAFHMSSLNTYSSTLLSGYYYPHLVLQSP